MLLCIIKHPVLEIEFHLFAEKDAGVEKILNAASSVLLVEVAEIFENIGVFEWLVVDVVSFDDPMRHLGEFLVVTQQLVGFELPFLCCGFVLFYVYSF